MRASGGFAFMVMHPDVILLNPTTNTTGSHKRARFSLSASDSHIHLPVIRPLPGVTQGDAKSCWVIRERATAGHGKAQTDNIWNHRSTRHSSSGFAQLLLASEGLGNIEGVVFDLAVRLKHIHDNQAIQRGCILLL